LPQRPQSSTEREKGQKAGTQISRIINGELHGFFVATEAAEGHREINKI